MDYADRVRQILLKQQQIQKEVEEGADHRVRPNTDYLDDPREKEFDSDTELKYQMRDKLGYASGGKISGTPPADPAKDNKLVPMRSGEYVIPEPVVKKMGKGYFDDIVKGVMGHYPTGTPEKGFVGGGMGDDPWSEPSPIPQWYDFQGSYYPPDWMPADKGPKAPYMGYYGGTDDNPKYSWMPPEYRDFFAHHGGDWVDGRDDGFKRIPGGVQWSEDYPDNFFKPGNSNNPRGSGEYKYGRGHGPMSTWQDFFNGGNNYPTGYPQGSAPWDYGQNPNGIWGNAGNFNSNLSSVESRNQALNFASNTAGQGLTSSGEGPNREASGANNPRLRGMQVRGFTPFNLRPMNRDQWMAANSSFYRSPFAGHGDRTNYRQYINNFYNGIRNRNASHYTPHAGHGGG